jgi:subtilisin family serine protease
VALFRVKAFFIHEHEADAARDAERTSALTETEWTDGYVLGVIDEKYIPRLARRGLVITPVEKVEIESPATATPSMRRSMRSFASRGKRASTSLAAAGTGPRPLATSIAGKKPADKIISQDAKQPQFYVVRLNGPLTEKRRETLHRLGVALLERLSNNCYTSRLTPPEVVKLADQIFVDTIRLYGDADTPHTIEGLGPSRNKRPELRSAESRGRTLLFAVWLHRAEDLPKVLKWLNRRGRWPISSRKNILRVALPVDGIDAVELAKLPEVAVVDEILPPHVFDRRAREIIGVEKKGVAILGFEGDGQTIGIADTGLDINHRDFAGRIAGITAWGRRGPEPDYSDPEGHGTHVAGCAVGDGTESQGEVKGAAPKAKLFFQSILDATGGLGGLPDDLEQLFAEAYQNRVRIHNNSWGAFTYARYTATSLDIDRFVAAHPDMLIVIAAGNDGTAIPRVPNATSNAKAGFVDWPCVAAPATAKNGLTVGASRSSRRRGGYATLTWGEVWADRYPKPPIAYETVSGNPNCLAAFSSRGPVDDRQIKPDLVAPGTDIAAARSREAPLYKFWGAYPNNPHYAFMGGTSMAAPYAAGCAALVREFFIKKKGMPAPSAALLKATLINGTCWLTGLDATAPLQGNPNFHQGFGRIDMPATIPNPASPDLRLVCVDEWQEPAAMFRATGQRFRYEIKVEKALPLRVCLAWTDVPARGLQNQLMLLVDNDSGDKFVGNVNAAATFKTVGLVGDPRNNVQMVRIKKPKPGTYTIAITADSLLVTPQAFAFVITGDLHSSLVRI